MKENKHTCQKKYYERRPYHNGRSELTENFPMKCGYNARNTVEYNWGLYGNSNEQIKELLGSRKVWEDKIGIDYDTALIRLLAYMPGMILPWHVDNLGNWCRNYKHLNPNIDTRMCDLGPIKRYLVMITDWHWGHVIQFENSYFPNYKSGDVFDLPIPRPHCSANMGMRIKLTCSISGAQTKDYTKMKLKHPISETRIDPKVAVPKEILEQYPWHWDPITTDHTDNTHFMKNIEFDWKGLGDWAIKKCNEHLTPQKYWRFDYEQDAIYHAKENVNNMPIKEQAFLAFKNNTHCEENSQYFKIANEEFEHWQEPLMDMFPELKKTKMGVSLFVQPPGHTMFTHVDTYSSFIRRTGDTKADYTILRRYMAFVRDWDFGHFFHYGNHCFSQWRAGDCYDLVPGVYHGSANAGLNPKITIHWSGELKDNG